MARPLNVGRYIKKPVEVEAIEWGGTTDDEDVIRALVGDDCRFDADGALELRTLHGWVPCEVGAWVVKSSHDVYPVAASAFDDLYHRALDEGEGTEVNVLHRVATADDGSQTCERCWLVLVEPPDVQMGRWPDGATIRETRPGASGSLRSLTEVGDAAPTCS